jgi:GNAT superfamily N-acetyltransferase
VESARAAFTDLLPPGHEFPQPDSQRWLARLEDPAVSSLLVEEDGELLGLSACGVGRDGDASVGELYSFFVTAGRWRRGIGRALMAAALDSLRERGCTEATVWTFAANERAGAFYESAGFTRDRAEEASGEAWAGIPVVRYRRSL